MRWSRITLKPRRNESTSFTFTGPLLSMIVASLVGVVGFTQAWAIPLSAHELDSVLSPSSISPISRISKRSIPAGMPTTCLDDFECHQQGRPGDWPWTHETVKSGNYACVIDPKSANRTGTCQFVVTAGELCNAATECAAFAFYARNNLTVPTDLCSPLHCTLESTCGSPWQQPNAPEGHPLDGTPQCCGGQPKSSVCSLVGSNVDSCQYQSICKFDRENLQGASHDGRIGSNDVHDKDTDNEDNPAKGPQVDFTPEQMLELGLGVCTPINQRNHVWIGVVITLISSTVLNLGLNGQKYALRKHDEKRIQKDMDMEEEHDRWRHELGWTEEQVEKEADRLYEEKQNRRGPLYRKLKPYMFWRAIFVSKLWAAGLAVFIVGNLGGFVALRFAPQSLTAPLGSISLISNVIIAPLINKEVLGRWDLAGIFFIVAGSVIVVVFSGIVAQDYKLCVLINLFQKPATIIYLSLIGVCIIGTYFFIKFVEKNVENESDMAIGVSSEQQLQQESRRLVRVQSNMSSLSLASKNLQESRAGAGSRGMDEGAGSTTVSAAASPASQRRISKESRSEKTPQGVLGEPLEYPSPAFKRVSGQEFGSSISHQTLTSDTSGTAVGSTSATEKAEHERRSFPSTVGTPDERPSSIQSHGSHDSRGRRSLSSLDMDATSPVTVVQSPEAKSGGKAQLAEESRGKRVSLQGHRLTFDEPLGGTNNDGTPGRPSMARSTSMTPSIMSGRARRRRRQMARQQEEDQGAGSSRGQLSFWQRIQRIEIVPTLADDKLIRRDSPLLRFCLPLSYAALGGMMASYTVLFAKSLINLLVTSIFDGQNQFTSVLAWVILVVTVVTAVSQVYWINMGLKKYDALLQVPVFFTIWVLLDIIGGGVYYGEFDGFTPTKYVLFILGVLIVFFGVAMLAKRLAVLAKEDAGVAAPVGGADAEGGSRRQSVHQASAA